jgi:hypothetical protein
MPDVKDTGLRTRAWHSNDPKHRACWQSPGKTDDTIIHQFAIRRAVRTIDSFYFLTMPLFNIHLITHALSQIAVPLEVFSTPQLTILLMAWPHVLA